MRVYQAIRSTLIWTLQATARVKRNGATIVPASSVPPTRWPPTPCLVGKSHVAKARRIETLLSKARPRTIRHYQTGRVVFDLRAGANMVTEFSKTIEASRTKSWMLLVLCICNETAAVALIKRARDASDPQLFVIAIAMYVTTLFGFAISLAQIDVSIAYAVWSALGTAIVSVIGILMFHESYSWKKLACLIFITIGVVGLNLLDQH